MFSSANLKGDGQQTQQITIVQLGPLGFLPPQRSIHNIP